MAGRKSVPIGTTKMFGSRQYIKTDSGWKYHSKRSQVQSVVDQQPAETTSTPQPITAPTFMELLQNPRAKSLIQQIEDLNPRNNKHKDPYRQIQHQLNKEFGFVYRDSQWENF